MVEILFPQDLFDSLADEAIRDLRNAGMSSSEICQILEDFLGPVFAEKYMTKSHFADM